MAHFFQQAALHDLVEGMVFMKKDLRTVKEEKDHGRG
jgi:hypothetical protein